MNFMTQYFFQFVTSVILIISYLILRFVVVKIVRRFARLSEILEHRTNLVIKYIHILLGLLILLALFIVWGVQPKNMLITISSIFAVIGVAMFAQWSILSNITSGIVLFFTTPFKIGDMIKIHDKDFPIEATVEDIRAFHTYLKTREGEIILYPNNLLLQKGVSVNNKFQTESNEEATD
jgi:small-conductance mechanosensitive channel